jgi:hypothetical protein
MLKVLPEAHSSDQSATNLSGGKIKRNKDPRESRAKFIVAAAILFCLWLIDSVGFYVAFGGASLLWLSLYLIDRKHNRQAKPKKSSETQALDRR